MNIERQKNCAFSQRNMNSGFPTWPTPYCVKALHSLYIKSTKIAKIEKIEKIEKKIEKRLDKL